LHHLSAAIDLLFYEFALLRSESPSGMCAKLHAVAASNNRDHAPRPLYYCLFAPHISGVVLRAHSVRGEPRIQRNANREVATAFSRVSLLGLHGVEPCQCMCSAQVNAIHACEGFIVLSSFLKLKVAEVGILLL